MCRSICETALSKMLLVIIQMLALVSCVGQETVNISNGATFQTVYLNVDNRLLEVGETATVTLGSSSRSFRSLEESSIEFFTTGGTSAGEFSEIIKNDDGTFETRFTGLTPGTKSYFKVIINGRTVDSIGQSVIRVTPSDYSLSESTISVSDAAPTAGDFVTITVRSKNNAGAFLTTGGLSVSCSGKTGSQTRAASAVSDLGNGTYTATYQAKEAANLTTISCKLNNALMTNTATFTASPDIADRISVVSGNNQTAAVTTELEPFVAAVKDKYGNTIAGKTVTWTKTSWTGTGSSGTLVPLPPAVTAANGQSSAVHTLGNNVGVLVVTAKIDDLAASTTFVANAVAGDISTFTIHDGNGQLQPIDTEFPEPMKVILRDANNNPVVGKEVTWAKTGGAGDLVLSPNTNKSVSDQDGIASIFIESYSMVEKFKVTATLTAGGAAPVVFDQEARRGDPATMTITGGNGQAKATDAELDDQLEVTVKDKFGNELPDVLLVWTVLSGGGSFPDGAQAITDANGVAKSTFKNGFAAGNFKVQVSSSTHSNVKVVFDVTSIEGTPTELVPSSGGDQEVVLGKTSRKMRVQLRDENSVPLIGKTISWTRSSTHHTIVAAETTTNEFGEAWAEVKVSDTEAEAFNVVASYPGIPDYAFALESVYHDLALAYFARLSGDKVFTTNQKRELSKFAQGLEDLGLDEITTDLWIMRSKFNVGAGNVVKRFIGDTNITLYNNDGHTWSDEAVGNPTRYGVCFNVNGQNDQYGDAAGTANADYNKSSMLLLVQRITQIGSGETYAKTSDNEFEGSVAGSGKGFHIGQTVEWGNAANDDYATTDVFPPLNFVTSIHTQVSSGTVETYTNGADRIESSFNDDDMGDSNRISFASKNGGANIGLKGCIPFAMRFETTLNDTQVKDLYDLIKLTVGSGMNMY